MEWLDACYIDFIWCLPLSTGIRGMYYSLVCVYCLNQEVLWTISPLMTPLENILDISEFEYYIFFLMLSWMEPFYHPFRWFSVVLYLLFLFIVIIVLLNILIAQVNNTYSKMQQDVEGTFAMARARIVARFMKGRMFWWIPSHFRCCHKEHCVELSCLTQCLDRPCIQKVLKCLPKNFQQRLIKFLTELKEFLEMSTNTEVCGLVCVCNFGLYIHCCSFHTGLVSLL